MTARENNLVSTKLYLTRYERRRRRRRRRRREMEMRLRLLNCTMKLGGIIILLHFSAAVFLVHGQSTQSLGFISIDCGMYEDSYRDSTTGITYVSDEKFIDTGLDRQVPDGYIRSSLGRRYRTLRSFPEGSRNCYYFNPIARGMKYIIRAAFLYGNYDLQDNMPQFDLYLDANLWTTIIIADPSQYYINEAVTEATSDHISVCLVNTGHGTPFISGLDLRPMDASLYPMVTASRSLVLLRRLDMGGADDTRYPVDRYDRIWFPMVDPLWKNISSTSTIKNATSDQFEVPSLVMHTAVSPADSTKLEVILTPEPGDLNETFAVMHFSELQSLSQNASRQFSVFFNNVQLNDANSFAPEFLITHSIYSTDPSSGFNITLAQTSNSTLPPILNALEVFTAMRNTNIATDTGDADAMMAIKEWNQVQKNWYGDPCAPRTYMWQGLNCTPDASGTPRITAVNLSSSELTGEISTYFANLSSIQYLDLSQNNLTGPIPAGLAYLPLLKLLDLTDNQLNGSVPSPLLTRSQNGSLALRIEGNPNICFDITCEAKHTGTRKKQVLTIMLSCIIPIAIILFVVASMICFRRKQQEPLETEEHRLPLQNQQFTCKELEKMTKNFERIIGKGGFGTVYHGYLEDDAQVAVKVLSETSKQGTKEFMAEAQLLTKIHHRNLVSLVGYCMDRNFHALVYEYMSGGSVHDHLKGKPGNTILSWQNRLHIALEAAKGLEYLHCGCKPSVIHRDVKTSNILLNEKFEAKIADFGLSRALQSDAQSHVSTRVVGTPGYFDPEYYRNHQLTMKSDVYSFGVVLLELITAQLPVLSEPERQHIAEWVNTRIEQGNVEEVMDARLQGVYDINSAWKCINLAMKCTAQASAVRPTMADVVAELEEILRLESSQNQNQNFEANNIYQNYYPLEEGQSANSQVMTEPSGR